MNFLEKTSRKLTEQFQTKRVLKPFYALFEAIDTFLLTPATVTENGSHVRDAVDMKRVMITVMIALLPPLLFGFWNVGSQHYLSLGEAADFWPCFGYGFLKWLPVVLVAYISGLAVEIAFAQWRGHSVAEGFFVTGMLIPMILPPDIPLWIVALATVFATLIGKEVFGGTGYNFMNPALLARAFVFFAYPSVISGDNVWIAGKADAFSGATPLSNLAAGTVDRIPPVHDLFMGTIPGCMGETSTLAILIGALLLIFTQVASWRIMLSVVAGGLGMGCIFNLIGATPAMTVPAYVHLTMGGFMFGAVYMATDPVTSPHSHGAQCLYGLLIGMLTVFIRVVNKGYPEGMMLAILLMNVFVPLIDYVTVQRHLRRRARRRAAVNNAKN